MEITPEIIVQAVGSALLFLVLWSTVGKRVFAPYIELLVEREASTKGRAQGAQKTRDEVRALEAELLKREREIRLQGIAERDEIVGKGKLQAQKILDDAQSRAERQVSNARTEVDAVRAKAESEMQAEAVRLAQLLAARVTAAQNQQTVH